jgi:large subunit ribosomal protein L29
LRSLRRSSTHLKDELFNLKFQNATGQLDSPMRVPQTKKDIARVLTVLREKELTEVEA